MVRHLKITIQTMRAEGGTFYTRQELDVFATQLMRRSNVHCNVCGGRGHDYKKCTSLKHLKREAGCTPIGKRLLAEVLRRINNRYRGVGNPSIIRRLGTDRKTAGNFKGPLMRDVLRTMKQDELQVSGLGNLFNAGANLQGIHIGGPDHGEDGVSVGSQQTYVS